MLREPKFTIILSPWRQLWQCPHCHGLFGYGQ